MSFIGVFSIIRCENIPHHACLFLCFYWIDGICAGERSESVGVSSVWEGSTANCEVICSPFRMLLGAISRGSRLRRAARPVYTARFSFLTGSFIAQISLFWEDMLCSHWLCWRSFDEEGVSTVSITASYSHHLCVIGTRTTGIGG